MEVMVGMEGKDKEGEMKCSPKYGNKGQEATYYGDCLVSAHHLRCLDYHKFKLGSDNKLSNFGIFFYVFLGNCVIGVIMKKSEHKMLLNTGLRL